MTRARPIATRRCQKPAYTLLTSFFAVLLDEGIMAQFRTETEDADKIVLRDVGPWDRNRTITNDAEAVVRAMAPRLNGRRLFYYDSEGDYGELLLTTRGTFAGFAHAAAPS